MNIYFTLICCLLCTTLFGCQSREDAGHAEKNIKHLESRHIDQHKNFVETGDDLPISHIVDVNGNSINLNDPTKRKLIILFATWCHDSNRALKALNVSPILNDSSIEIIAIAREETKDTVIAWRDEHNIKVQLAVDVDRSIYEKFSDGGIPRMVTVGKDNKIIKMNLAEGDNQLALIQW